MGVPAAISVESAIQKLISVGESVMSEGDDLLKSHMPTACDQVCSSKIMLSAAVNPDCLPLCLDLAVLCAVLCAVMIH